MHAISRHSSCAIEPNKVNEPRAYIGGQIHFAFWIEWVGVCVSYVRFVGDFMFSLSLSNV